MHLTQPGTADVRIKAFCSIQTVGASIAVEVSQDSLEPENAYKV